MTIPTPEITDLRKTIQRKLNALLLEKAVAGYAFSWSRLSALLSQFGAGPDEIAEYLSDCVLGVDTESIDDAKKEINDKISEIYSEEDLTSLRATDPFGRRMEFLMFESRNPARLDKEKMIELAPSLGIPAKKLVELIKLATPEPTTSVKLVARGVREGK